MMEQFTTTPSINVKEDPQFLSITLWANHQQTASSSNSLNMQYSSFSQWCCWKFKSSGTLRRVYW